LLHKDVGFFIRQLTSHAKMHVNRAQNDAAVVLHAKAHADSEYMDFSGIIGII
jgi:hypothetical protein